MEKLQWPRKKVMSWVEKENPSLKHARPRELVDRGQGELVIALLEKRENDRKKEDKRRQEKIDNKSK
jgi:D-lyxose ketol-isomerase